MSTESVAARAANKAKAKRMCEGSNDKVDASDWTPDTFSGEKKTGKRPINPREYRAGGKVAACHAGKKPRTGNKSNYEGGTRPTGGRIARADGGMADDGDDKKKNNNIIPAGLLGGLGAAGLASLKTGGRAARKSGGRTKGKTNINIIINPKGDKPDAMAALPPPPPGPIHPPGMAMPPPGGAPGAGAPPPMPMPPPGGPMGRKRGGRTYKDMTAGAGSGEGRLEKTAIQSGK